MEENTGLPDTPTDVRDETLSASTSSSRSSTRPVGQQAGPPPNQDAESSGQEEFKKELERVERRNSIVDSGSGRISPPATKKGWEMFIKR